MGSIGSWKANIKIKRQVEMVSPVVNSEEKILEFIEKNKMKGENLVSKLKNVDLKELKGYLKYWDQMNPTIKYETEKILRVHGYIYGEFTREDRQIKITQNFIDSLKPGDIIELSSYGSCY